MNDSVLNYIEDFKKDLDKYTPRILIIIAVVVIGFLLFNYYKSNHKEYNYLDAVRDIIIETKKVVNRSKLIDDTNVTYYISAKYVKEKNNVDISDKWFEKAYIGVTYDNVGYNYYFIGNRTNGDGIRNVTAIHKLGEIEEDNFDKNIKDSEIINTIEKTGIGNRETIKILGDKGVWEEKKASKFLDDYMGSIPSCPKCRFTYNIIDLYYTTWNTGKMNYPVGEPEKPTKVKDELYSDYREVINEATEKIFLGLVLNENKEITKAYLCGKKDNIPFCLESSLVFDRYKPIHNKNKYFMQILWDNKCKDLYNNGNLYCKDVETSNLNVYHSYGSISFESHNYEYIINCGIIERNFH